MGQLLSTNYLSTLFMNKKLLLLIEINIIKISNFPADV